MTRGKSLWFCVLVLTGIGFCEEDEKASVVIDPFSAYGFFQCNQIVEAVDPQGTSETVRHVWRQEYGFEFYLGATAHERVRVECGMGLGTWYPHKQTNYTDRWKNIGLWISKAFGEIYIGDTKNPIMEVAAGYMPVNYNRDATNFGEYMFRTTISPGLIFNFFDSPVGHVGGIRLRSNLLDGALQQDLYLYTDVEVALPPLFDGSIAYVANYKAPKVVDVGVGFGYEHLIPQDKDLVTPEKNEIGHDMSVIDSITTIVGPSGPVVDTAYRAVYRSFAGAKLNWRLVLDPKDFFPNVKIFGEEDLKIYHEGVILGLANQTWPGDSLELFNRITERMPVMFGFNFPCFKILDKISLELEIYKSRYPANYQNPIASVSPVPNIDADKADGEYSNDNVRWSVYAKKTFFESFGIVFQAARDHTRHKMPGHGGILTYEEWTTRPGNWHWWGKVFYKF